MTLYEKRTYSVVTGQMGTVVKLYQDEAWPALEKGGFAGNLVGYFISDTGPLHQLIHIWKFDGDAGRREFWKGLYADADFMAFAAKVRPLLKSQEVQLMIAAPWGPHP